MHRKNILLPTLLALCGPAVQAQVWNWANGIGSPNSIATVKNIRPSTGSNVILCGSFAAPSLVLGGQTLGNSGQDDGYVAIANAEGEYLWASSVGGSNSDHVLDAAANASGEFAVIGDFRSTFLTIDDTTLANNGESDAWVVRYNADRSVAWVRQIGGQDIDEVQNVQLDATGNTVVSGQVIDKFTFATINVFVRKYSPTGSLLWEQVGNAPGSTTRFAALAIDAEQNVYAGGGFFGTLTFGGTTFTASWSNSAFIVKFDAAGTLTDTTSTGSLDNYTGIQVHGNNLYACAEKVNWSIGWGWPLSDAKIRLLKLDTDLNTIWQRETGGEETAQSLDLARSLSVDAEENIYVTGTYFSDTLFFADDTLANPYNASYYYPQVFIIKYSASGEEVWGTSLGGLHTDEATSICALGNDRFYIGGNFESDPVAFGEHTLHNTSTLEEFYVHLSPMRYGRMSMGFLAAFNLDTGTGVLDAAEMPFSAWPNPVDRTLIIRSNVMAGSPTAWEIASMDGRVIRSARTIPGQRLELDVSDLSPGSYLAIFHTPEGRHALKFIRR